jgi:hypothetical protein
MAYAGDLEPARTLNDRGLASAVSATMISWGVYVAGEIETLAGRTDLAEEQYVRAIELGRVSGATFLVGVATVGLLSVRVSAGRIREALTGYRDVIDYFAGTGNWTHLWPPYATSRICSAGSVTMSRPDCWTPQPTMPRMHRRTTGPAPLSPRTPEPT